MSGTWEHRRTGNEHAVSAARREEMRAEVVERVQRGEDFAFIGCGDTMVIALRMEGDGEVYWLDCVPRAEGGVPLASLPSRTDSSREGDR